MSKANNNHVVLCAIAVGLLLCSLPTTWATINNAQIQFNGVPFGNNGPFGETGPSMQFPTIPGMQLNVTGFNGHITMGVKSPIWLLVLAAAGAAALGGFNAARITAVPPVALLIVIALVGLFMAVGLFAMLSGDATLGIGAVLAIAGLGFAVPPLLAQTSASPQKGTPPDRPAVD